MYTPYVSASEYAELGYGLIDSAEVGNFLIRASRNIDTLTFNRIVAKGFDNLTDFQKGVVKEAVCEQADFLYENEDAIDSVLSSYSINGVTMNFAEGLNISVENGVPIKSTVYSFLKQTGLCWRGGI